MQIGSAEWVAMLIDGAAQMGVAVSGTQAALMARHAQVLLDWNRKLNLTAISDPVEVAIKHCLDAILPLLHIPLDGPLLDIGTGGGFPGIPLKIMRPEQFMTLIDGSRKKVNFVKFVIRDLQLHGVEAIQVRAQDLAASRTYQGRFQVIVARALADFDSIIQIAIPLLAPGGKILLYKGPGDAPQSGPTPDAIDRRLASIETVSYRLPVLGDGRTLVMVSFKQESCN
jgi:16S rRNA (guanine527-N7)-methyltransferase